MTKLQGRCGSMVWVALVTIFLLSNDAGRAQAALTGTLEEPAGISSGVGNVRGWVYSTVSDATIVSPIDVFIDGVLAYQVPCCAPRGDVKKLHPAAPLDTGFSGAYNWGLVEPGMHDVSVVVKSSAGESKTFSNKVTTVRIGDQTFLSRLRLTEDSTCTFGNESPGADLSFRCTNLLTEKAKDGAASQCLGNVSIAWDKATQGFKIISGCTPPCESDVDCDDGVFCNGVESCDIKSGLCVALSSCPPFLDGCVVRGGLCDEATDTCLDQPDHASCDDGVFCNGIESCDVTSGACVALSSCPPLLDGCVTRAGICDEATDTCLDDPDHASCDDGLFCNGLESCDVVSGSCVAISSCPPLLDGCVIRGGICDEATDSCLDDPDHAACDDGLFCNGVESCDVVSGSCVALSSCPPFQDGCVVVGGICDEGTDTCLDDPDDTLCPTGQTCQPDGSCAP